MCTIRGVVHAVIAPRPREYRAGTVMTLVLRDVPAGCLPSDAASATMCQIANKAPSAQPSPASSPARQQQHGSSPTAGADADADAVVDGGASGANVAPTQTRVLLFDEWAQAVSFAAAGDLLELRAQFRTFPCPDSDGRPLFRGGRPHAELLVTATDRTELSVFSKSRPGEDVIELSMSRANLGGEPVARVCHGMRL